MEVEKSSHSKKLWKTHVIELISNLGHVVSAIDDAMKNCEIFIQTVLYHRTSKEIYVETRVQLYKKK